MNDSPWTKLGYDNALSTSPNNPTPIPYNFHSAIIYTSFILTHNPHNTQTFNMLHFYPTLQNIRPPKLQLNPFDGT